MGEKKTQEIIAGLTKAYWMEIETTINYLANSIDLDGIRGEEIRESLATDVQAELKHAQELGERIKDLAGKVPGSAEFKAEQKELQPPQDTTDVVAVIRGVIAAEQAAIEQYNKLIRLCDGVDYVTQDLCIRLLADEERHLREFRGFLLEYEKRKR